MASVNAFPFIFSSEDHSGFFAGSLSSMVREATPHFSLIVSSQAFSGSLDSLPALMWSVTLSFLCRPAVLRRAWMRRVTSRENPSASSSGVVVVSKIGEASLE